jgi:hypothetical protein
MWRCMGDIDKAKTNHQGNMFRELVKAKEEVHIPIGMNCDCKRWASLLILYKWLLQSIDSFRVLHIHHDTSLKRWRGFWIHQFKARDLPLGSGGNLHKHACVNFSCLQVKFILHNFAPNVNVDRLSYLQEVFSILTQNGEEVLECICGDNVWFIRQCPPKSNA